MIRLTLWITFIITNGHLVLAVSFTRLGTMNNFRGMALSGCFLAFAYWGGWIGRGGNARFPDVSWPLLSAWGGWGGGGGGGVVLASQTSPGLCLMGRVDQKRGVLLAL